MPNSFCYLVKGKKEPVSTLTQLLQDTPYASYTYAYPHKTAYRHFPEPVPLADLWQQEKRDALFLYLHVPFCEMRCGFCNLFTTVDPSLQLTPGYLDAVVRQAKQVRAAIGKVTIARMAIGGGTPTFLDAASLDRLLTLSKELFGVQSGSIPTSIETSPLTATSEKLHLLHEHGVDRISIGVQSFIEAEARAAGRPQQTIVVEQALDEIRRTGFPLLNIDLIYGLPGQTVESWLTSLRMALRYHPEELYLYPLYVRPLTGLDRTGKALPLHEQDIRLTCYRVARELLLAEGYTQVSMRMFQAPHAPAEAGPVYCVQDDGMLGLGCGARSYTRTHHYSNEYAVGSSTIRSILHSYVTTPDSAFAFAHYGYVLNEDEQRRRYVLKSLLEAGGLTLSAYEQRFGSTTLSDLPMLHELLEYGLASIDDEVMTLTPTGLERSDTIGPWLYSSQVQHLMEEYSIR
jgi:oxygen-independent coproporphyrinogen-3 oxidase